MPKGSLLIQNATRLSSSNSRRGDCLIRKGKIVALDEKIPVENEPTIDASGLILAPGYIDLQCNGGFGHDFTTDPTTIWPVAAQLPRFGVTSFLPTIITSPLQTPTPTAGIGWGPSAGVRLVTLAPELTGGDDLIARLIGNGVIVSAGHSMATFDQAISAFEAGVRYGTHLFNAMPPLRHREPGLVGALLADERATIGLIPDGVHVHPALIASVWKIAGNRLNIVTDAMAAMGCGPGVYQLGNRKVTVDERAARLEDGTLAGSIITLDQAVRNLKQWTGCTAHEAIRTVTEVPAKLLGLLGFSQKGSVAVGADADLLLLTEELEVEKTIISGKIWSS